MENRKKLTETQLRILRLLSERPVTFRDLEETHSISKPTFAAFARLAKELGLVQTGELCGYYYAITPKGRKILSLHAELEDELEREAGKRKA
jgi:DNA-binding MarR family transcriptional regulator